MGFYILGTDGAIVPTTGDGSSIRREGNAKDPSRMSWQRGDLIPAFDRPEGYRSVSSAGKKPAVWGKIEGIDRPSILESAEERPI